MNTTKENHTVTLPRYRAWCLSWDDDEDRGSDIIGYDILTHDWGHKDYQNVYMPSSLLRDASDAAEAYADYVHNQRDGYEASWPLQFRVRCPNGSILDFEVDREAVPEFTATLLEPK